MGKKKQMEKQNQDSHTFYTQVLKLNARILAQIHNKDPFINPVHITVILVKNSLDFKKTLFTS